MPYIIIILSLLLAFGLVYMFFIRRVRKVENNIIQNFLKKVSKIPALIEVMRGYVVDEVAFDPLIKLHSDAMIHKYESIYILLEHNARIYQEFLFLMKLSMQIPTLQKNEQFLYIRDFIMKYERDMKHDFAKYNTVVTQWNKFVLAKNITIVGFLLPGSKKEFI